MYDGFSIESNGAGEVSDQLEGYTTRLRDIVDDLNRAVNAFVQNNDGPEIQQFQQAQSDWQSGYNEIQQLMSGHGKALRGITDNYISTSQQSMRLFMS